MLQIEQHPIGCSNPLHAYIAVYLLTCLEHHVIIPKSHYLTSRFFPSLTVARHSCATSTFPNKASIASPHALPASTLRFKSGRPACENLQVHPSTLSKASFAVLASQQICTFLKCFEYCSCPGWLAWINLFPLSHQFYRCD